MPSRQPGRGETSLPVQSREDGARGCTHSCDDLQEVALRPPRNRSLAELGLTPRLLTRDLAASYCSLSVQGFSEWVRTGRLPGPIEGTSRWDLKAIDAALDLASGILNRAAPSPLDEWRSSRARRAKGDPQGQ
jgi:hypothetical protein